MMKGTPCSRGSYASLKTSSKTRMSIEVQGLGPWRGLEQRPNPTHRSRVREPAITHPQHQSREAGAWRQMRRRMARAAGVDTASARRTYFKLPFRACGTALGGERAILPSGLNWVSGGTRPSTIRQFGRSFSSIRRLPIWASMLPIGVCSFGIPSSPIIATVRSKSKQIQLVRVTLYYRFWCPLTKAQSGSASFQILRPKGPYNVRSPAPSNASDTIMRRHT